HETAEAEAGDPLLLRVQRVIGTSRAHGAMHKERQVCSRRRVGEATGSCRTRKAHGPLQL
ncbi:MAG: hypothetical protein AABZ22_05140, partial [Nitrospirota bacterium]